MKGKGENDGYHNVLDPMKESLNYLSYNIELILSSANAFNLDLVKIIS